MKDHRTYSECILSSHLCQFKVHILYLSQQYGCQQGWQIVNLPPWFWCGNGGIRIEGKKEIYQIIIKSSEKK
jgi:hypothetical protein